MGKKTRKTRWRTLSIEESPSDTESQPDTYKPRRWVNGAHHKYNYTSSSSQSTPQHHSRSYSASHQYQSSHGSANGAQSNGYQGGLRQKGYQSRSSSTASEVKLTFNEEEYTKITTPRQDVLFKKGYLSKPKPYLQQQTQQQSLTSAGNSTGDGTPDHQSADGADYPENDMDVFYPPELFNPNLYYLNYDPATNAHPMLLYDQYGNTALCYPHPPAIQAYQPTPAEVPRNKRYSVDSVTESEEATTDGGTSDAVDSTKIFSDVEVDKMEGGGEEIVRKKRKRRKEDENNEETSEKSTESSETSENLRVDAEEFIPRTFIPPQVNLIPVIPHDMFPGYVFMPPAFYPPIPANITEFPPNVEQAEEKGPIDIAKIVSKLEEAAREQKMLEDEEIKIAENSEKTEIEIKEPNNENEKIDINVQPTDTVETKVLETNENEVEVTNLCSKEIEKTENQHSSTLVDDTIPSNKTENSTTSKYSDRLKKKPLSSTNVNTPSTTSATRQVRVRTGIQERQGQRTCPRLDRQAKVNHMAKNGTQIKSKLSYKDEKEIEKLQSDICIPHNSSIENTSSLPKVGNTDKNIIKNKISNKKPAQNVNADQWISVSGKKKRKQKQLIEIDEPENTEISILPVEDPPNQPIPEVEVKTVDTKTTEIETVEVKTVEESTNEVIIENNEKSIKKEKNRSANKKQVKKRIIITDGALQLSDGVSPISPKIDAVGNTEETKEVKTEVTVVQQLKVKLEPVILAPTNQTTKPVETTPNTNETKKSKKKKNKKHVQDLNNILDSSGDDSNLNTSQSNTVACISEDTDDTDVSLELDRMIQRGLYSNLEQKLQYHNPGDSFLSTFQGNLFATKSKPQFPSIVITQNNQSAISSKATSPLSEINDIDTTQSQEISLGGLSITQAVREWMFRTRENTPEVEIFRKPQELNEEIISKVMDLEITEPDVVNNQDEFEDVEEAFEDEVEEIANEASMMTETHRSRSASCDLSWDYDLPPTTTDPHSRTLGPIDQAQDALETYDSLYGHSRDFERIQNEVFGLRHNRRSGESLPYRAICCTVM